MFRVHAPIGAFAIHALFELDMFIIELCNSHSVNSNQFQCINIEKKNATVDLCRFLYFCETPDRAFSNLRQEPNLGQSRNNEAAGINH